jgi:hypothetical protein
MNCTKCGSEKIIRDQPIPYFSHGNIKKNLSVSVQKTDRVFLNKFEESDLLAQICCGCGDVQLTINNREALWEAYQESKK